MIFFRHNFQYDLFHEKTLQFIISVIIYENLRHGKEYISKFIYEFKEFMDSWKIMNSYMNS